MNTTGNRLWDDIAGMALFVIRSGDSLDGGGCVHVNAVMQLQSPRCRHHHEIASGSSLGNSRVYGGYLSEGALLNLDQTNLIIFLTLVQCSAIAANVVATTLIRPNLFGLKSAMRTSRRSMFVGFLVFVFLMALIDDFYFWQWSILPAFGTAEFCVVAMIDHHLRDGEY